MEVGRVKYLALALVVCTLVVCTFVFGLPEINKARELDLAERVQAAKERDVHIQLILVQQAPKPRGMQVEPSQEASEKP